MRRFYSNENIALALVDALRRIGHDVLTSLEAGKANLAISDAEVLEFASQQRRILLTYNRRHFLVLHKRRVKAHSGLVLLTFDPDFKGQADRITEAVGNSPDPTNELIRVNRPNSVP